MEAEKTSGSRMPLWLFRAIPGVDYLGLMQCYTEVQSKLVFWTRVKCHLSPRYQVSRLLQQQVLNLKSGICRILSCLYTQSKSSNSTGILHRKSNACGHATLIFTTVESCSPQCHGSEAVTLDLGKAGSASKWLQGEVWRNLALPQVILYLHHLTTQSTACVYNYTSIVYVYIVISQ